MDPFSFLALSASLCTGIAPFLGVVLFVVLLAQAGARRQRATASSLGLQREGKADVGEIDGLPVRVRTERRGGKHKRTWTIVEVELRGAPTDFHVVGGLSRDAQQDLNLGDPPFDAKYRVDADGLALAWLSAPARLAMVANRFTIQRGRVVSDSVGAIDASHVRAVVEAVGALQVADPIARLREIAASDPSRRMRARAIRALHEEPGGADTALLERWAGEEGLPGLIAATCLSRPLPPDRVAALEDVDRFLLAEHLVGHGTPAQIAAFVDTLPANTPRPVWFQATEAAARHADPAVREAVARAATRFGGKGFAADRAVVALVTGGPEVEPLLTPLLLGLEQSLPDALGWLERHGTVGSVAWLDRVLEGAWPMTDTRERAQRAKRAIQARTTGDRGAVALAEASTAGGLSEADGVRGALAEPSRPRSAEGG